MSFTMNVVLNSCSPFLLGHALCAQSNQSAARSQAERRRLARGHVLALALRAHPRYACIELL